MKNRKLFLHLILLIAWNCKLPTISLSQNNIGINITGATPNASAALDIDIPNMGILIPRVALTATNSASPVTSPATSLIVYNTATAGTPPFNVVPGFYYWDGTQWVQMVTTTTSGGYTNFQVFNSSSTFTVPAGITRIMVEVWGGGGGGYSGGYFGGGGGGYGKNIFTVTPSTIYTVTIGSGGNGWNGVSVGSGGTSSFGSLISAAGGSGGSGSNGGTGGTSTAPISIQGGFGNVDSGGNGGLGGTGGFQSSSSKNGIVPGGGGGTNGVSGGNGASGRVIVWW